MARKYNVMKKVFFIIPGIIMVLMALLLVSVAVGSPVNEIRLNTNAGIGEIQLFWNTGISGVDEFRIYRSSTPGVIPTQGNYITGVEGFKKSYSDIDIVADQTYYFLVVAVSNGREYFSNQVSGTAFPVKPHGNYTENTVTCALCHQAHWGFAPKLLADTSIKGICYLCHSDSSISIYNVEQEYFRAGSGHWLYRESGSLMECSDCHNPHDGGRDGEGNQITLVKLLEVRLNGRNFHTGGGEQFCYSCHEEKSAFYPTEGSGHNSIAMRGQAEISCLACHESHAADLPYLLRTNPQGGNAGVTGVNSSACLTCHQEPLSYSANNAWDGAAVYNGAGGKSNCFQCHNPHGTAIDDNVPPWVNKKYLNYSYDVTYSQFRTKPFEQNDYNSCIRSGCHAAGNLMGSGTNFKDATREINLHAKHLDNGYSNAVCKECHRPHGAINGENPSLRARVGFPAETVAAGVYEDTLIGPVFFSISPGEGTCNLSCHGVIHTAGEAGPQEINSVYSQDILEFLLEPIPQIKVPVEEKLAGEKEAGAISGEGQEQAAVNGEEPGGNGVESIDWESTGGDAGEPVNNSNGPGLDSNTGDEAAEESISSNDNDSSSEAGKSSIDVEDIEPSTIEPDDSAVDNETVLNDNEGQIANREDNSGLAIMIVMVAGLIVSRFYRRN